MRRAGLMLLAIASHGLAQPVEDAAHRADRLRTAQLNRDARDATASRGHGDDAALRDYQAARARYSRRLAEWRRRVAACEAGEYSACER